MFTDDSKECDAFIFRAEELLIPRDANLHSNLRVNLKSQEFRSLYTSRNIVRWAGHTYGDNTNYIRSFS